MEKFIYNTRKTVILILSLLLLVGFTFPVYAYDNDSDSTNIGQRRVNGYAYTYKVVEERISEWSPYKTCFGQPPGGTVFHSTSSGIFWTDSSRSAGTWNISIQFSAGPVSVGVSLQPGVSGVTGELFTTTIVGVPVLCQVRKKYVVKQIAVYRYDQYAGPQTAVYDSTVYSTSTYQIDYRFIRA